MPQYTDDPTTRIANIPTRGLHITHLDAFCHIVQSGRLATAAHMLMRYEAVGYNVPEIIEMVRQELKKKL